MNAETTNVPQRRDQTPEKLARRAAVAPTVDIFEDRAQECLSERGASWCAL